MSTYERWLTMTVLCLSGGVLYLLPFLSEVYYIPMQQALGFSKTQMGLLMSVFGAVSLASYFPGGWLADRVSSRKLMTSGLVGAAIAGFIFSTLPSFTVSLLLHAFWGACTAFAFWASMIKVTRNWAPKEEQGRAFGILESGRGLGEIIASSVMLAVFAWLGSGAMALTTVVQLLSVIVLILGVMTWLVIKDGEGSEVVPNEATKKVGLDEILLVLKLPVVWLIAIVIMTAYAAYWGTFYFTPYATEVFMMSVVLGGAIGVGKMWLKPLAALGAGFLADRLGASTAVVWAFVIMTASYFAFALIPGSPALVALMITNVAVAAVAVFALRGIYFALLEEGGIPVALTGTATGIVSAIGYTPDVFMPLLGGVLLDANPGAPGYQHLFLCIAGLCGLGLVAAVLIMRGSAARRASTLAATV